jgi:hypothetical protein
MRLALKLFRGEPAISKFVWHITPTHSSSPNFATLVSSGLHEGLTSLHPDHGWITWFRVYSVPLNALFRLAFATASGVTPLTLRHRITRRIILRKARRQACRIRRSNIALRLFVSIRFQVLFHSPNRGAFHLSLTVLVHYRSPKVFSLGRWTPQIPTGLACPVVLKDTAEV